MASTFSASLNLSLQMNEFISEGLRAGAVPPVLFTELESLADTSSLTYKGYYEQRAGIAASTTTVYNLVNTLLDESGDTIDFDLVHLIAIKNRSTDTADHLLIGPDATNGFGVLASNAGFWADASDRSIVMTDSWMVLYSKSGVPAATGSTDELAVITPSGSADNTWDILIIGRDS